MPRATVVDPTKGRLILAKGEQTGHHHSIKAGDHVALLSDGIDTFLTVQGQASLTHQEHSALSIDTGDYEVVQQRRVNPWDARRSVRAFD